jgi:hypothetical protein
VLQDPSGITAAALQIIIGMKALRELPRIDTKDYNCRFTILVGP